MFARTLLRRRRAATVAAGVAASAFGLSSLAAADSAPPASKLAKKESGLGVSFEVNVSPSQLEVVEPRIPDDGLSPTEWRALRLESVTPLSHNTAVYRFAFEDETASSGMRVASCLLTKAAIGSEKADGSRANVIRPYTPISRPDAKGHVDLAVKTYPDGKMSQHIASLKVGDTLEIKGPVVKLPYKLNEHAKLGMIAGGTGIAPMLQVIDEILAGESAFGKDNTKVSLIFANVSEQDILLKEEVDRRAAANPSQLEVFYLVDKASSPDWSGGVGYVTKQMLAERMPPPGSSGRVFVCGPPPMVKARPRTGGPKAGAGDVEAPSAESADPRADPRAAQVVCGAKGTKEDPKAQGELSGMLKELGYAKEEVFKF